MPKEPQGRTDRQELIEARERIKEQLAILENPMRAQDMNPQLIYRLRAMLEEIRECLAETDQTDI
ncbi:MAG TPA: hypothetical protein VKR31_18045 [Rhizomicrobium sp.]|nr:hypothetical protein [Rhizomicrobium sp.]